MNYKKLEKPYTWVKKYFLNIFGMIGVVATFYFSIFYVPTYVDQLLAGRASVIHESIVNDVQEILFNNEKITVYDIQSLIKGKELSSGAKYHYDIEELLVQVEDRFMSNKFIPLKRRAEIIVTINKLRKNYKPLQQHERNYNIWNDIRSWSLSGLGVLLSILGAISLSEKYKREREIEADIDGDIERDVSIKKEQNATNSISAYYEFEKDIRNILLEIGAEILGEEPNHPGKPVSRPDFEISINNHKFLIECRKYKKLVGLRTVKSFMYQAMEHAKPSILISSTNLTSRALEALNKHNNSNPTLQLYSIVGVQKDSIKKQLKEITSKTL